MSATRFLFAAKQNSNIVFDSTPKTRPCPHAPGGAPFYGGSAGTHIHDELARTVAASLLRPKREIACEQPTVQWRTLSRMPVDLTRGRNPFAGGIYA